ncbi:MAG: hypothetical protein BGO25_03175 [Acidobacteriales bacterium 59-55]|nr:MAG: hypothetical protein BGO25_03175 [Acidobacteriales bacterium 59-55]
MIYRPTVSDLLVMTKAFYGDNLLQCQWMFGFNSAELGDRKSTTWVALQVFNVGSGTGDRFFQRLYWAVAIFAAHELAAFSESFVKGAWKPTAAYFDLALRHYQWFLLRGH